MLERGVGLYLTHHQNYPLCFDGPTPSGTFPGETGKPLHDHFFSDFACERKHVQGEMHFQQYAFNIIGKQHLIGRRYCKKGVEMSHKHHLN